jgi:transcriptional regulator with XRE-family HTH domain
LRFEVVGGLWRIMSATVESHEVLRDALEKVSPKEVASEMGLSLSMVYKWAQPQNEQGSGSMNPLDRCAELMRLTKDPAIIQWLCAQADGFFVKNPRGSSRMGREGTAVMPAMNQIVQQFADLLEAITKAALDSNISPEESRRIRTEWEQLKTYAESFVHACEKGDFSKVKQATFSP